MKTYSSFTFLTADFWTAYDLKIHINNRKFSPQQLLVGNAFNMRMLGRTFERLKKIVYLFR